MLPEEQTAILERLRSAEGQLDAVIAIGTDIAIEASDVTLVRGELTGVVEAITLSRETFKKIKQNLF